MQHRVSATAAKDEEAPPKEEEEEEEKEEEGCVNGTKQRGMGFGEAGEGMRG
jgi:hypothetical protein